jgi:hypothetical protein
MQHLLLSIALLVALTGCTSVKMTSYGQTFDTKTGTILTNGTTASMTCWGGGKQSIEALKATSGRTSAVGATGTGQDGDMSFFMELLKAAMTAK